MIEASLSVPAQSALIPPAIQERVKMARPADWVTERDVDLSYNPTTGAPYCLLLADTQHHCTTRARYERMVYRLNTLQAVYEAAQWRLEFDPRTQWIVIHSLAVRRAHHRTENAFTDRLRFLQREENLDRFVIDGRVTLMVLLEDVRIGDILDLRVTIMTQTPLLGHRYWYTAAIPSHVPVGAFHLSVRFPAASPMRWKSKPDHFSPHIRELEGETEWSWKAEKQLAVPTEVSVPAWHSPSRWVQFSDCESWGEVAAAVHSAWAEEFDSAELSQTALQIAAQAATPEDRAQSALELVQDHIRYLSVNIELGGQIPARPGAVLQRRFGDCKDKSFLLALLLRRLGIPARPILVNTRWQHSVADWLPMPDAFNHVVVEYELDGTRFNVDPTVSLQGGDARHRAPHLFQTGLPVGPDVTGFAQFSPPANRNDLYELSEVFLLETTQQRPTELTLTITARGREADALRFTLAMAGAEALAQQREAHYQTLFPGARRLGTPLWEDDRRANELVVTEYFALPNAVVPSENPQFWAFTHRAYLLQSILALPEQDERQQPLEIPFPREVVHVIVLVCAALPRVTTRDVRIKEASYRFTLEQTLTQGRWASRFSLSTLLPAVPAEHFKRHKRKLLEWCSSLQLSILIPAGTALRHRKRSIVKSAATGAKSPLEKANADIPFSPPLNSASAGNLPLEPAPALKCQVPSAPARPVPPPAPPTVTPPFSHPESERPEGAPEKRSRSRKRRSRQSRVRSKRATLVRRGLAILCLLLVFWFLHHVLLG